MSPIKFALFLKGIYPVLRDLARFLYQRFNGDVEAAKREITRIRDHWAGFQDENARIDAELEQLRRDGK